MTSDTHPSPKAGERACPERSRRGGAPSFWANGDGKNYAVAVETESTAGQMPGIQPFVAGAEWKQYTFSWSDFKTDGHDVTGIAFAHAQGPGKFGFEIDEVEIK